MGKKMRSFVSEDKIKSVCGVMIVEISTGIFFVLKDRYVLFEDTYATSEEVVRVMNKKDVLVALKSLDGSVIFNKKTDLNSGLPKDGVDNDE